MLKEIIETKDFDFSNYIELQKYTKFLGPKELKNIINILNNDFDPSLYTEQAKTLSLIGLRPRLSQKSSGASKYIHGIYHVEKVFLYCYLMVKMNNLDPSKPHISEEFEKILYYAALYHDIGRVDNNEETLHGTQAAEIFAKKFKDIPFFKEDERRMYLVECLMSIHSEKFDYSDEKADNLIKDALYRHDVKDWNNAQPTKDYAGDYFKLLSDILKDADALDRKRFGEWNRASLDEDYLRTEYSRSLVHFASEINNLYYSIMRNSFVEPNLRGFKRGDCFHSIGFDFFKIKSILNNGILSQDELKKRNIKVPRNFPGGNFDRWISIVDASFYPEYVEQKDKKIQDLDEDKQKSYASEMFTHQGITFYCQNVPFRKAEEDKDKALEKGFPWNKSDYVDEKYVYLKILPDNIIGVFIPRDCLEKDIKNLWYIFESTNMDIIRSRVEYYVKYAEVDYSDSRINRLLTLLDEYERIIVTELKQHNGEGNSQEYLNDSHLKMTEINHIIGEFVYEYYASKLNTQIFNVSDIVEYELSQVLGIDYFTINKAEADAKEVLYVIEKTDKKSKIK